MRNNALIRTAAVLVLASLCGAPTLAQTPAETATLAAPPAANSGGRHAGETREPLPASAAGRRYTVGVADVLRVSVWKNPDLSQTVTVGPDGFASLPLLGDVHMAGITTDDLAKVLTSRLSAYVVNPQVTVSVVEIRSRQVYVVGQVARPGGYPLIGPMSVLQMLAQAGGLDTFASRKQIYVLRSSHGKPVKLPFNYSDVIRGKGNQNIALEPGDTVVVP